jgi:hypothetical protein
VPRPTRRARGLLVALLVAASALALASPEASASSRLTASFTPQGVLPGDHVTASGSAPGRGVRPVQLQLQSATGWAVVVSSRTTRRGRYSVTDPVARTGAYRVVLPRARVRHHWRGAVSSPTQTIGVAADLADGRTLASGQSLTSPDGRYRLTVQVDGDLVLVALADPSTVVWHTSTTGHPRARLVMQRSGNLVLVDPQGLLLWNTGTTGSGVTLSVQSTGDVVVHAGSNVLWDRLTGVHVPTPPVNQASQAAVRGNSWVAAKVSYSQKRYYANSYGRYRTDCSGFVSMMWALTSSYTTWSLPTISHVITKDQLRSGDILNSAGYHTVLFDAWANAAHTRYWGYEETPNPGATHHVIPYPYWSGHRTASFVPRRQG